MDIQWLCIHMHVAIYPCACGCVSTCMFPWICVHMAMYPHGPGSMCRRLCIHAQNFLMCYVHIAMYPRVGGCVSSWTWPCIHVVMYPHARGSVHVHNWLWTKEEILIERYERQRRILLCAFDHFTEFCSPLRSTVQNFIKHYGPPIRMINHNADLSTWTLFKSFPEPWKK